MRTKPALTDEDVRKMAAAAEAHAAANQWNVTVAIFDDGGHLLYLHRGDNTAPSTVDMAIGKGRSSRRVGSCARKRWWATFSRAAARTWGGIRSPSDCRRFSST